MTGGGVPAVGRSFGVEEELLLVDMTTLSAVAAAGRLISRQLLTDAATPIEPMTASKRDVQESALAFEVEQEQIEVVSTPLHSLAAVGAAIRSGRSKADTAARLVGARAVAMATSIEPVTTNLVPTPRYQAMMSRFGLTMKEQLTCGFHVHVAIESAEEGVAVLDRIRIWLPLVLALSTNSPFWQGADSGYASYRYQAWSRWPSSGPTDIFGSELAYRNTVASALATGVLLDEGMIYFDARLSRTYPTVEIRIADVCLETEHAAVIAAVVRALVETAARQWHSGEPPPPVSSLQLRMASWQASKWGTRNQLIHPLLNTACSAEIAITTLLEHARPVLTEAGDATEVESVLEQILLHGTGAERQRAAMARTGSQESRPGRSQAHSRGVRRLPLHYVVCLRTREPTIRPGSLRKTRRQPRNGPSPLRHPRRDRRCLTRHRHRSNGRSHRPVP